MAIETDSMTLSENKHLHQIVDELFEEHGVTGGPRHKATLRRWILANSSSIFSSYDFRANFTDNPLIKSGETITVPLDRLDLLEIISDRKISRREIGRELEAKIAAHREQRQDSCCCFANGGVNYEFYIKEVNGASQIWYKKNGAEIGEYSDGKYYTFQDAEAPNGILKSFSDSSFELKMVTLDNNRALCYGKKIDISGNITHHFFWSQMEDEFPAEPGGVRLPGVYVRERTSPEEQTRRFQEMFEDFFGRHKSHPAWVMQLYGGKLSELLNGALVPLPGSIKNLTQDFIKVMPIVVEAGRWYEVGLATDIFDEVYDIGVANPHRYEHYKKEIGGEVMSFIFDTKLEDYKSGNQKFTYQDLLPTNLIKKQLFQVAIDTAFPNFKVHDGMGYNDGTCNFFVLAKVKKPAKDYKGAEHIQAGQVTMLWCDEQEFFSKRWKVIHPDDCHYGATEIGTYTSVFPVIKWFYTGASVGQITNQFRINNWFKWNDEIKKFNQKFVASLPYDELDRHCRISTARSATVLTAKDKIYSISSMWGVADFGWNSREYPPGEVVFPETVKFRDDMTIYMMGYYKKDDSYILGYWYQKYLPPSILQNNFCTELYSQEPFEHPWYFAKKEVFEKIDSYYNLAIYDAYYEKERPEGGWFPFKEDRAFYAYKGIDERSQYYKVKLLSEERLDEVKRLIEQGPLEWAPHNRDVHNPFFLLYGGKKNISISLRWDEVLECLIAVYTHPWDDDILIDMESSGFLTEYFPAPIDHDLRGNWKPVGKTDIEQDELACLGTIYFKPNKAELRDKNQEMKLQKLATFIRRYHLYDKVRFYGHCAKVQDEVERISQALSEERAKVVYDFVTNYIINKAPVGYDPNILSVTTRFEYNGFGSELPEATNKTEAGMKLNRRVEVMVETKYFYFKMIDRIRDFSPPSVKKVKLKKNGNSAEVTFTTNDDSIRYITLGAIVGGEARPISSRYKITKETDELFETRHLKEKLKEKLIYLDDVTSLEDLKDVKSVNEVEKIIKDLFDSVVTVQSKKTLLELLSEQFIPALRVINSVKDFKDVISEMQKKAEPEPLPDPVDITVTIPLLPGCMSDDFFKEDSHMLHGTSVWFEDIQGHKAIAEELEIVEG